MKSLSTIFGTKSHRTLSEDSHTPLYHQLYTLLKASILDGTIENGVQMPTELQLAEAFSVSRITVKRAMDELSKENLVERRRAKGTHVTYQYKPQPVKAPLLGMLEEIESMARHSDVTVLECERLIPPAEIRDMLGIESKGTALNLVRIRSKDKHPFGYYHSWTSGLSRKITAKEVAAKTRLELFREHGLVITHVTQTLSAVAATTTLAKALELQVGDPVLTLSRKSFTRIDGDEKLMDLLEIYYNPSRFQYQMDLEVE
jgi:GntR family transcriptional regulator